MPFLEVDPAYTSQRCPRCAGTQRRPTAGLGTISVVVGAASLGPPTTSPGWVAGPDAERWIAWLTSCSCSRAACCRAL
ncbi:hypothetical protein [Streptomyces sp. CB01635]|uniref:hypothetical protein n=1 Tax=Streptomyces sp. CB01635 TaxID=2020326 RepID=UPI003FA3A638